MHNRTRRRRRIGSRLLLLSLTTTTDAFSTTSSSQRHSRRVLLPLPMVLTTPESIIEKASTQKLLDDLIDESVRTSARRPVMMQFDPSSGKIWRQWKGTVFSEVWRASVNKMIYAACVYLLFKRYPVIKETISGMNVLWGQLLTVTTFTITFFVNQSYALWRKCYELSRRLQGRLHDLDMSLAIHAARKPPTSPLAPSTYTPAAHQILDLVSRYVRIFNLLTYASFTRSHRPILTPRGMRRLVERGLLTPTEREILVDAELPATQRHNAVLLWIARVFVEGRQAGHFEGGAGFETQFLEKLHVCRSAYGAIGDELQGRMPLAYAHIVQVLVDGILYLYPLMAIASGMSGFLTVMGTGLLTVSYQGLFDLAKQLLDPYDNESYGKGEDPLVVDTLIAETNAGSLRWMNGLERMPVSAERIRGGDLSDYLLPHRGFSLSELDQMEAERLEREREFQERLEREEAKRKLAEEKRSRILEAASNMIPARFSRKRGSRLLNGRVVYARGGDRKSPVQPDSTLSIVDPIGTVNKLSKFLQNITVVEGYSPGIPFAPSFKREVWNEIYEPTPEVEIAMTTVEVGPPTVLPTTNGAPAPTTEPEPETATDSTILVDSSTLGTEPFIQVELTLPTGSIPVNGAPILEEVVNGDGNLPVTTEPVGEPVVEPPSEPDVPEPETITYEQFKQKIEEILETEKEELLETEAILNAPPAADSVGFDDHSRNTRIQNATAADDLAILEMDNLEEGDVPVMGNVSDLLGQKIFGFDDREFLEVSVGAPSPLLDSNATSPLADEFSEDS